MIKRELIQALSKENPSISRQAIADAVTAFFDRITVHMADGGRVELRGFGAFFTKEHRPKVGQNPMTGATYLKDWRNVPRFRVSPLLAREITSKMHGDGNI